MLLNRRDGRFVGLVLIGTEAIAIPRRPAMISISMV
jgi:hypothetical protein